MVWLLAMGQVVFRSCLLEGIILLAFRAIVCF